MVTEEKPTPTKEQMLVVLDTGRGPLMTKPDLLLSCARLYGLPEQGRGDMSWARRVMNYPATERLFDRMEQDGLIVGKLAHVWMTEGVQGSLQTGARYYATARKALHIQQVLEKREDGELRQDAEGLALRLLASKHPEQYKELVEEAYEALLKRQ